MVSQLYRGVPAHLSLYWPYPNSSHPPIYPLCLPVNPSSSTRTDCISSGINLHIGVSNGGLIPRVGLEENIIYFHPLYYIFEIFKDYNYTYTFYENYNSIPY
jgi:hypothetical protein